jgi:starch-binding outer membrane protein, SusD/RagB family
MKTFRIYLPLLITLLAVMSCDNYLDVQPKETIPDTNPIFDKTSAEQAVRAMYNKFYYGAASYSENGTTSGGSPSFEAIGYLSGGNVKWTGSQSQIAEFEKHRVNAENSTVSSTWTNIYRVVNLANNVLARVPQVTGDPKLTDALRNQYLGEAYFIRALAYFDLARVWGGVPIITKPTIVATDNVGIGRGTVEEAYAQVLSDLEAAEPLLPETTDRYRATCKTVWALRARYHLYQREWALAEGYADKLIADQANYKLVGPYNSFFFPATVRGSVESVFEIFFNGTTEINNHFTSWQIQANGGTRQWAPSDEIVTLLNNPDIGGNRNTLIAKDASGNWYNNLYYRKPGADPAFVIRIAELYLIRAEARANLEKLTEAVEDLDAVRQRAGLSGSTATTQEEILDAIALERRVEFAFEHHRWFDLVRTDRAADVLSIEDKGRYVMPIPAAERLVDITLDQNDAYK